MDVDAWGLQRAEVGKLPPVIIILTRDKLTREKLTRDKPTRDKPTRDKCSVWAPKKPPAAAFSTGVGEHARPQTRELSCLSCTKGPLASVDDALSLLACLGGAGKLVC